MGSMSIFITRQVRILLEMLMAIGPAVIAGLAGVVIAYLVDPDGQSRPFFDGSLDMSDITVDRSKSAWRLYMRGDLQFDVSDERLYHEPLALLPALLAAQRCPARPLRALILGGGDGLAAHANCSRSAQ